MSIKRRMGTLQRILVLQDIPYPSACCLGETASSKDSFKSSKLILY